MDFKPGVVFALLYCVDVVVEFLICTRLFVLLSLFPVGLC